MQSIPPGITLSISKVSFANASSVAYTPFLILMTSSFWETASRNLRYSAGFSSLVFTIPCFVVIQPVLERQRKVTANISNCRNILQVFDWAFFIVSEFQFIFHLPSQSCRVYRREVWHRGAWTRSSRSFCEILPVSEKSSWKPCLWLPWQMPLQCADKSLADGSKRSNKWEGKNKSIPQFHYPIIMSVTIFIIEGIFP